MLAFYQEKTAHYDAFMVNITLVSADEDTVNTVSAALERQGYNVSTYFDGVAGLMALESSPADLAIIETKLPRLSGTDVLRLLRQKSDLPVLILTSKDDEAEEREGFDIGADDCVRRPLNMDLLLGRIRAVLRRVRTSPNGLRVDAISSPFQRGGLDGNEPLRRGPLTLDPARHECIWNGMPVHLSVTEFLLLRALAEKPGYVKTRNDLKAIGFPNRQYIEDRIIDSHIKRIRQKLRTLDPNFGEIETVYGIGYRYREL